MSSGFCNVSGHGDAHDRRLVWFSCFAIGVSMVCLEIPSHAEDPAATPPMFRSRTDPMAAKDADEVRERLKRLSDARGPINPLGDYVPSNRTGSSKSSSVAELPKPTGIAQSEDSDEDEEATRAPTLDSNAQRRLKAEPPSASPSELSFIGLYPPPRIVSNNARWNLEGASDDGFRPITDMTNLSRYSPVDAWQSATTFPVLGEVLPVTANYLQNDPAAMLPPTLGSSPTIGSPAMGASGVPTYGPPPGSFPSSVNPSIPSTVMPAPPSYIVPGPSNSFPGTVSAPVGQIMPSGVVSAPYSESMPTYSRSGTVVNSAPFVSPPPRAQDARWMVAPEVFRRGTGNACGPVSMTGTSGIPGAGMQVASTPFFYAPPVSMPPASPITAGRKSLLHPFRHP